MDSVTLGLAKGSLLKLIQISLDEVKFLEKAILGKQGKIGALTL